MRAPNQAQPQKPLETYDILIPIENIKLNEYTYEIAGVKLFEMTPERAAHWGITKAKPWQDVFYNAVINKTVARVCEKGNDSGKATDRARERVNTALRALRISLIIDHKPRIVNWKIHDIQMLFKQGEWVAIRKQGGLSLVLPQWSRSFRALELSVTDNISKQIEESVKLTAYLFKDSGINRRIKDRLIRAMGWISNSIVREELDDKIVDLCTALESLLVTEDEGRKGELISLRMTLLAMLLGEPSFDPVQLLEMYKKRSKIVHGSDRKICTDSDYTRDRWITIDVFRKVLTYIQENNITRYSVFISNLQRDKVLVKKAVNWWKQYPKYYKDVLITAQEKLCHHSK